MVIAIDGPAGSGKTTVAKLLAKHLGISYLDTGATYRALTYSALNQGIGLSDEPRLISLARKLDLKFSGSSVYLSDKDISSAIRTPQIDKNISAVVSFSGVREIMVSLQRRLAKEGDFVVEGRDIASVVFPGAEYKFYLDAAPRIRAERRFKELKEKGLKIDSKEVGRDLERRDRADKTRETGPLKISEGAKVIDTSGLSIEQVVAKLAENIG